MESVHIYEEEVGGIKQVVPDFETFSTNPAQYMAQKTPAVPDAAAGQPVSTEDDVLGAQQTGDAAPTPVQPAADEASAAQPAPAAQTPSQPVQAAQPTPAQDEPAPAAPAGALV